MPEFKETLPGGGAVKTSAVRDPQAYRPSQGPSERLKQARRGEIEASDVIVDSEDPDLNTQIALQLTIEGKILTERHQNEIDENLRLKLSPKERLTLVFRQKIERGELIDRYARLKFGDGGLNRIPK